VNLQSDGATWAAFGATTAVWAASLLPVCYRGAGDGPGWRRVFLSLFGFAWAAFGALFMARFLALTFDPELFRATRFPMWRLPARVLTLTWVLLGLYWVVFCAGVLAALTLGRTPRLLAKLDLLELSADLRRLDFLAVCSGAALLGLYLIRVPRALATPMGHLGALWVIPAAMAWFLHFRGQPVGLRRYAYLVPGAVAFLASPYREHLLMVFLCVFVPMLMRRRQVKFPVAMGLVMAVLLMSSVALYVYRPVKWQGESWDEARAYADWNLWRERPKRAPWVRLSRRFHGFDSAALTVYLMPDIFPFLERDLLSELLVSAFVPRAVYQGKSDVHRGRVFSVTIWAYDGTGAARPRASAMIAPSMAGDLWEAGGWGALALGALLWGLLVGLLESWRRSLRPGAGTVLLVLMGLRVAGGMERDFVHACSTVVQVLIVFLLVLALLPVRSPVRVGEPALPV